MLELAKCRECGEVKLCIPFRGSRRGEPTLSYLCPECDEKMEDWLEGELQAHYEWMEAVHRSLKRKGV